jgi:vitamin B12 transporter
MQRNTLAVLRVALFNAGLFTLPVQAQDIPLLDEIVVTATRIPTSLDRIDRDVTVIKREEIEAAGQTTLVELLRGTPGIEINQIGGAGAASSVFLRGANAQHTLVLVDGVRMNSPTLGIARLEHLPVQLIERIEVVRGPMSHLYGSDAIGGVIQIFTRKGEGKPRLSGALGLGAYDRKEADIALTGAGERWRYAWAAGISDQAGFSAKKQPAYQDKDGYRNEHLSFNLEFDATSAHQLGLHGMHSKGESQFDDGATAFDSRANARTGNLGVNLKSTLSADWASELRADFAHEKVETQGYFDASPWGPGSTYASRIDMDQWQYAWQLDGRTSLGAVQALLERLEWDVGGDVGYTVDRRTRNAVLLGWRRDVGAHGFQASLRRDDDSQFGAHDTGMASYALAFSPHWRGSIAYATAFRAPSFDDLYWPGAGNPALQPERGRNLEAGLRYTATGRQFGAFVYRNKVQDLIQWAPTGVGGNWQPSNIARADMRGLTLSWQQTLGNYGLRASLDLQDPEDASTGKQLILRSRQHANLGVDYAAGGWNWAADWLLQGERYNDAANTVRLSGYGLLHLSAARELSRDWSLLARLENALDQDYERSSGYNTPGRNLFVSLRYQPK